MDEPNSTGNIDEGKPKPLNIDYKRWGNISRAVLNGVVGDYLVQQNNPLAIDMGFYHDGVPLQSFEPLSKANTGKGLTNKVVVLLHGLTNLETIWDIETEETLNAEASDCPVANYGYHLQKNFGYTPLFMRYNTGLNIEENGRQFAQLMDNLASAYPKPIDEIVFVGFSMGGLLMRYAQKAASESQASWLPKLSHCFYLGTPHEGSYFEKFGHLASSVVRSIPKEYISHWADWIDVRSEGIQDLKHGLTHLRNADAEEEVSYGACGSFHKDARHYFISGSLSEERNSLLNKVFGDSLVTHRSANPDSAPENSRFAHFDGVPHMPLAHTERVYQQMKQWIIEAGEPIELITYNDEDIDFSAQAAPLLISGRDIHLADSVAMSPSKQEMIAGALDLMAVGFEKTIDAVEKVHLSVAKEPHVILKRVPVVEKVSKVVDTTHIGITETIYHTIRQGGKLIQVAADLMKKR